MNAPAGTFEYTWSREHWIVTVQVERIDPSVETVAFTRLCATGSKRPDLHEEVVLGDDSHRFMISRRWPEEHAVRLEFDPRRVKVSVFELLDRAYYPTEPLYVSSPPERCGVGAPSSGGAWDGGIR